MPAEGCLWMASLRGLHPPAPTQPLVARRGDTRGQPPSLWNTKRATNVIFPYARAHDTSHRKAVRAMRSPTSSWDISRRST